MRSRLNGADPRPPIRPAAHNGKGRISANVGGAQTAIRATLNRLAGAGISHEIRENVQIVLTEIVNNVVEHAYQGASAGPIGIEYRISIAALHITVTDRGRGFPGGVLPDNGEIDLTCPRASLPEGGFGWPLIRRLTSHIIYVRNRGQNRLDLWFNLPA